MKKILLSAALVLGMMTLTTGCTDHNAVASAKKCGASGKCNQGKCGNDKKDAKKCSSGKCGSSK